MDAVVRLPAARWVMRLGRWYGALLAVAAAWALLGVVVTWSPVALLLPALLAGCAAGWGAVLRAFTAHRRGARQLLLVLAAGGVLSPLLLRAGLLGVVGTAISGALLGLLLHPDSRDWVTPAPTG